MKYTDPLHNRLATPTSRREMLRQCGTGFGMLGLANLLAESSEASTREAAPLAPQLPMYSASVKQVIFLFMSGGPSHVDTFDPKPQLLKDSGKPLPFDKPALERTKTGNLLGSPFQFKKHGQSGIEVHHWH